MKNLIKLSKTAKLLLSAGIFIVIVGSLGMTYSQQVQQQKQLDGELDIAEKRVNKMQVQDLQQRQGELQQKRDEAALQLAAAKDKLRQPVASIDVVDEFYVIADGYNIEVNGIYASAVKQDKLENIACSMTTINAAVSGKLSDMINFISSLNNDLTTGIVNSTTLSITETDEGKISSTNLRLTIYSYEGD